MASPRSSSRSRIDHLVALGRVALPVLVAVAALASLGFSGCGLFDSAPGSGGSGGGTTPPAPTLTWWPTCGLPGCPAKSDPPAVPCNADERPGAPCDYANSMCDARLACGANYICAYDDPRAEGCQ